jgi:hypothetical protein
MFTHHALFVSIGGPDAKIRRSRGDVMPPRMRAAWALVCEAA